MKVKWLIESLLWEDDSEEKLINSLKKSNTEYYMVTPEEAYKGLEKYGNKEECVYFYGSLETARTVVREKRWIPGVFYTAKSYYCSTYYPYFGDFLLNSDNYGLYPFGDLNRIKYHLYRNFGEDDAIFIRPNDGKKSFTGKLVKKEEYDKDIEGFGFYGMGNEELVLVSTPKNVVNEWRFFIAEGKVITGSLYKENGKTIRKSEIKKEAEELASKVCGMYIPDSVWTLDICETEQGNFYVLEIGCASCSGLYACDTDKIVETINKVATKEYYDYLSECFEKIESHIFK